MRIGHTRIVTLVLAFVTGCAGMSTSVSRRATALTYLYPNGAPASSGEEITLQLPLRVAVAFAPGGTDVPEELKLRLLERVAASFREREFLERVEVLPSSYLTTRGSFEELDTLSAMLGFTEVVLVSYDQHQFSASGSSSWTYWTIVGAAVVEGEKNETKTVLDAVVFDLPSRSFLLRAAGQSSIKGESLLLAVEKKLDAASTQGFELAVDDLVANLDRALSEFESQAVKGTVRGPGTPAVAVLDSASGRPVAVRADGSGFDWGGALDPLGIAAVLALLALAALGVGHSRSDPE